MKVQAEAADRATVNDVYRVRVRASSGELVPLQAVVEETADCLLQRGERRLIGVG